MKYRQPTPTPPVRQSLREAAYSLAIGAAVAIAATAIVVFGFGVLLPR